MDAYRNTRRQSIPKPETDLAEWTSKIKAMQRQVDADEETEQRRLEEEIAAARQARLRRSRGGRPTDSTDFSRAAPDDISSLERRDATELHLHQSDALRKIIGQNAVYVPEATSGGSEVSLASFIGGRAAGPRLNKHAPQFNAHDPTQFSQPDVSTPHPIFGRGGVAMPGMVSKNDLGGGPIKSSQSNQKAISDLKAVASTLGNASRPSNDTFSNSTYLRQPDEQRRKSMSPTPGSIAGTEAAERYRPSGSPTPSSTIRAQKSFDRGNNRSYGTEDAERYRPSASPTPSSTLRPQKSFNRSGGNYGTEDAERPRPSASPAPTANLRTRKSFDRGNNRSFGTEDAERYRPSVSPIPKSALKAQKSFERNSKGSYGAGPGEPYRAPPSPSPQTTSSSFNPRATDRSSSPYKLESRFPVSNAAKSTPDLRSQKSWTRSDERPVSPQKTGGRERAISTPKPAAMEASADSTALSKSLTPGSQLPTYLSSTQGHTTAPASRERTISTPNYLPKGPLASQPTGRSITAASLARPIQPEPRALATIPKISPSVVPSPAFQRPDQPKEITPSISRLQGRGFVQNMVKASLTLETHSAPVSTTSTPTPAEKFRPSGLRKGSVLDRWQPQNQATPSSPISPVKSSSFSTPIRRATTADPQFSGYPTSTQTGTPTLPAPSYLKPTKSSASFPSEEPLTPRTTARMMEKMVSPSGNIGSATTAFVEEASAPSSVVDDFGVKRPSSRGPVHKVASNQHHSRTSEIPAPTGKPLIHPTKDRAKRPKKMSVNQTPGPGPTPPALKQPVAKSSPSVSPQEASVETKATSFPVSKIGRLTEQWMDVGPITPKTTFSPSPSRAQFDIPKEPKQYAGIRHALPGMVKEPRNLDLPVAVTRSVTPKFDRPTSNINTGAAQPFNDNKTPVPPSPGRIPSSGSRATVMEVAQALTEHGSTTPTAGNFIIPRNQSPSGKRAAADKVEELKGESLPRSSLTPGSVEKRKSSYDSFAPLPPLKEEATPAPSPANTLTRLDGRGRAATLLRQPSMNKSSANQMQRNNKEESGLAGTEHLDPPVPPVDLSVMLRPTTEISPVPEDAKTISVDVMSIVGSNSTTLSKDENVFYDSETLAVIHRVKLTSSGLVDTYVWGWLGKRSEFGEAEEKKLHELARRYGTTPVIVRQCSEPIHLSRLLGGRLAIRQGARAHWTADNTAMRLIRAVKDVIFIDEHDLNVQNLCSGFSYCVSALGTVYVWYGTGSVEPERTAAQQYAKTICGDSEIVELTQGENDDNEMFWMILGDTAFADANYWRWRRSSDSTSYLANHPSFWRVDSSKRTHTIAPVEFISNEANPCQSVYIVNCIWELFVVVGASARGRRQDIHLALDIAARYSREVSLERPYTPNVHVLILPSQIPLDLKLHVRDIDENVMNRGDIPDHMNLLSLVEASEQLAKTSWDSELLKDQKMLPLGVDAFSAIAPA